MTSESSRTFVVVSHTHWDREWYQPFSVILSANHARARNPAPSRRDLAAGWGVNGLSTQASPA